MCLVPLLVCDQVPSWTKDASAPPAPGNTASAAVNRRKNATVIAQVSQPTHELQCTCLYFVCIKSTGLVHVLTQADRRCKKEPPDRTHPCMFAVDVTYNLLVLRYVAEYTATSSVQHDMDNILSRCLVVVAPVQENHALCQRLVAICPSKDISRDNWRQATGRTRSTRQTVHSSSPAARQQRHTRNCYWCTC